MKKRILKFTTQLLGIACLLPSLSYAAGVGDLVDATTFSEESHPNNWIIQINSNSNKVSHTRNNSWLRFADFDFGTGSASITLNAGVNSGNVGGSIELRTDSETGPLVGSILIDDAQGWNSFVSYTAELKDPVTDVSVTGEKDLYVVFTHPNNNKYVCDLQSFQVVHSSVAVSAVGDVVLGNTFVSESHPNNDSIIKLEGDGIGSTQNNSWAMYSGVDFGTDGATKFTISASMPGHINTPATLKVYLDHPDGEYIGHINVTATTSNHWDWSVYQDFVTTKISSKAKGIRDVYFVFSAGQFNVDNFKFEYEADDLDVWKLAVPFDDESDPHTGSGSDQTNIRVLGNTGGTMGTQSNQKIGWTALDAWVKYDAFNFGNGAASVTINASSPNKEKYIDLYVAELGMPDLEMLGRVEIGKTGDWKKFKEFSAGVSGAATGIKDLYVYFSGGLDIDAIKFNKLGAGLGLYPVSQSVENATESPKYSFEIREAVAAGGDPDDNKWLSLHAWYTACIDYDPNFTVPTWLSKNQGERGYYSNYIGGWSNTYCNFEMAENTPIEIKVSAVPGSGITFTTDANGNPTTTVHPADKASISMDGADLIVTLSEPALFALDINNKLSSSDAPRSTVGVPGGYFGDTDNFRNEVNGAQNNAIHSVTIFANAFISDKPDFTDTNNVFVVQPGVRPSESDLTGKDTLYFAPGIHDLGTGTNNEWVAGDQFVLEDFKSYYIPGNAIVYGNLNDNDDNDGISGHAVSKFIKVYGHGTLSGKKMIHPDQYDEGSNPGVIHEGSAPANQFRMLDIRKAQNCTYEGVTVVDQPYHGVYLNGEQIVGTENVMKWMKLIGWRTNNDGMSAEGNGYIQDSFMRVQDDGTYVRGMAIQRMVYWHDVNGTSLRTTFITNDRKDTYSELLPQELIVEDIDVIFGRGVFGVNPDISYGVIGNPAGGINADLPSYSKYRVDGETKNTGQHVIFRNINFTDQKPDRPLFAFTGVDVGPFNPVYKFGDWAGIRFQDITVTSSAKFGKRNLLRGQNSSGIGSDIRGFIFDNVTIEGNAVNQAYIINNFDDDATTKLSTFTFN